MFDTQIVNVSSRNSDNYAFSIVPNFMFVNKPLVKISGNKTIKTKRLIVWFDIKNESGGKFDIQNVKPEILLKNFRWQLLDIRKGSYKLVKPASGKEEVLYNQLLIKRNISGLVINSNNTIVYDLDADDYSDNLSFQYNLSYDNNQKIGITHLNNKGFNSGVISINTNSDSYVFNNAVAYVENANEKEQLVNQDKIGVKKRSINRLDDVKTPLAELEVENKQNYLPEIVKSAQLRAELDRLSQNEINYLETNEKGLKIIGFKNSFKIYENEGSHYDFQTDKWVTNSNFNNKYHSEDNLKIDFKFNHQDISIDWAINDSNFKISSAKLLNTKFDQYVTYSDVKQNTKFNTFLKARNNNLWK